MMIFDGYVFAKEKERQTALRVANRISSQKKPICIASLMFQEDAGSQLYTNLKREAAQRVGIEYRVFSYSLTAPVSIVIDQLHVLNQDVTVTGIIIQKPTRSRWQEITQQEKSLFTGWWRGLVTEIAQHKDVDGLHPKTLEAIQQQQWQQQGRVFPATAQAALEIIDYALHSLPKRTHPLRAIILGKSDILGQPLYFELKNQGWLVEMLGTEELRARQASGQNLTDADVIVSATGRPGIITGDLIQENAILIDIGEPKPDINLASVSSKAAFITPVPGGVGPVTIQCLLENAVRLSEQAPTENGNR
jgi:methylenetetrahydrofolate dehydrogenase (NADP+)/methenyltetrahydrofolate cyclohydrolase